MLGISGSREIFVLIPKFGTSNLDEASYVENWPLLQFRPIQNVRPVSRFGKCPR